MIILILIVILFLILYKYRKEKFVVPIDKSNLQALARNSLQNPRLVDLSKVDWSKLSDAEYSDLICQIEGCDERPSIKNLSV